MNHRRAGKDKLFGFRGLRHGLSRVGFTDSGTVDEFLPDNISAAREHPFHHSSLRRADRPAASRDAKGAVVWEYEVPLFGKERKGGHGPEAFGNSLFSAMRLPNGNTLIGGGNGHCVLEVTPAKEIVWKIEQNDLPGITLAWVTRVERLANGNTLIGNCHAGPEQPQFVEVTPEKKVVWTFKDFTNFGNSMPVQAVLGAK